MRASINGQLTVVASSPQMSGPPAVKVVMLGGSGVGKTTLVEQWCSERYDPLIGPTYSAAFRAVAVEFDAIDYTLQIWDTAGQDQFNSVAPLYCRDACAAMVVFDVTSLPSFVDLPKWIGILHERDPDIPFLLVGNKIDLPRTVSDAQVEKFRADFAGVELVQTSAKTGDFVPEAFAHLVEMACAHQSSPAVRAKKESSHSIDLPQSSARPDQPQSPAGCC
jgi:small GTP-binding protein